MPVLEVKKAQHPICGPSRCRLRIKNMHQVLASHGAVSLSMYVIEALFNNILPCDSSQVQESEGPVMREGADKNPPEEESLMLTEAPHRNSE